MTKEKLIKSMQSFTGCAFITRTELRKFMGYSSPQSVDKYIASVMKVGGKYLISDVADEILRYAE